MSGAQTPHGYGGLYKRSTWFTPYANYAALPVPAPLGAVALTTDTLPPTPWEFDGTSWVPFNASGPPTGPAGGDLQGTYPNPQVKQSSVAFALTGVISPPALSATTNNYAPAGLAASSLLRLSASTPGYDLTGLTGGTDGRIITIHNVGAFPITLTDEDPLSAAANRFALVSPVTLTPDSVALLQYDAITGRWRTLSGSGSSSGAAGGDLAGFYPNPTLSQRGAAPGDVLTWDAGANDFIPKPASAASFDPDKIVTADYTDVFNTEGDEVPLVVIDDNGNVVVSE